MNQINKKKIIKKAKRKFMKHKWIHVYVKEDASLPYEKSFFSKFIADSNNPVLMHKDYILYIHEDYLTIRAENFLFEPVKVPLHDKLWVELYCVFDIKDKVDNSKLMHDTDNEPI